MKQVAVVGATGYVGGEVVRWLLQHREVELAAVVTTSKAGVRLDEALPGLLGLTDLVLEPLDVLRLAALDAVILCTPHGAARELVVSLDAAGCPLIVDASADHRHAPGWVYGQPEWAGEALVGARRVASPGCFATAIGLAIAPFAAAKVITGPVTVAACTGSTGSGVSPVAGTHHPERFHNFKAYKVLEHQHTPEIKAFLAGLGQEPRLVFVPASAPLDRGIFATCFVPVAPGVDPVALVSSAYAAHPLIRIRRSSPELRLVRGTAFCDLAAFYQDGVAVVLAAIDNLGRGASAQVVQALEVALDLQGPSPLFSAPLVP